MVSALIKDAVSASMVIRAARIRQKAALMVQESYTFSRSKGLWEAPSKPSIEDKDFRKFDIQQLQHKIKELVS